MHPSLSTISLRSADESWGESNANNNTTDDGNSNNNVWVSTPDCVTGMELNKDSHSVTEAADGHEYRRNGRADCTHDWRPDDEDVLFYCTKCGAWRA